MPRVRILLLLLVLVACLSAAPPTGGEGVSGDGASGDGASGDGASGEGASPWLGSVDEALAAARQEDKPVFLVFRCER